LHVDRQSGDRERKELARRTGEISPATVENSSPG